MVLVTREGDPAAAIAVAVTTAGLAWEANAGASVDDPEAASALAGLVESRLKTKGIDAIVTPSWDGLRASVLAMNEAEGARHADAIRDAFASAANETDLVAAKRKLNALGQRPLRDRALGRWARCVGQPHAVPERAGKDYADLDLARLERWRANALGLGRVAIAVTGPPSFGEAVASAVLRGPAWKAGAPITPSTRPTEGTDVEVFEVTSEQVGDQKTTSSSSSIAYVTLDVGTSSAAVAAAEALGDPRGPLAARLSELDMPFRLREVTGAAHARGGCVGVILEAAASSSTGGPSANASSSASGAGDLAARVADAIALVQLEATVHLAEIGRGDSGRPEGSRSDGGRGEARDGRLLSRRSGDAREAAERAAWWALVDQGLPSSSSPASSASSASSSGRTSGGSVALGIPARRGAKVPAQREQEAVLEPSREALIAAVSRATTAWEKPVVEARSRVESGQGEAWILLGSPCGTDGETEADAGLTAIFTAAAADGAKASNEARVEPWVVADGVGLLVHGPALAGESPTAHARRLADIAARSFAAEPITGAALSRARADLLRRDAKSDGPALSVLATALAPQHPSWIVAWGSSEPLARSSDAAVLLRAQAVRAGPLRVAVLANADTTQADAAVRAADRWVARRSGDARTCRSAPTGAQPPKPGTYAAPPRPGSVPEAYLAFPFPAGDEATRAAADLTVAALNGDGSGANLAAATPPAAPGAPGPNAPDPNAANVGLLDKALGGASPLARSSSAHVLGWPRAPALVIRIVAAQASLDAAVMQARGLIDRLHKGGLAAPEFERATGARSRSVLTNALDPRARVVATWRGEPVDATPRTRVTAEDVRAFAQKHLAEDTMVIVASRPGRPPAVPTP